MNSFPAAGRVGETFNLARLFVGSEGTLGLTVEAKLKLVELPRAKAMLVVQFADLLEALAATPMILRHGPAAVEVVDQYVLDSTRLNPEANRLRDFLQGDPAAILLIEFYGDRRRRAAAAACRPGAGTAATRLRLPLPRSSPIPPRRRGSGSSARWRLGSRWPRKAMPRRSRSSRTRPWRPSTCAITSPSSWRSIARHGTTAGVYAHASVGCLHVRPVINLKTDGGCAAVRGDRRGCLRAGAQVRRCAFGRAWRRPGSQSISGEDVWDRALPGVPGAESGDRPGQLAESRARSSMLRH